LEKKYKKEQINTRGGKLMETDGNEEGLTLNNEGLGTGKDVGSREVPFGTQSKLFRSNSRTKGG